MTSDINDKAINAAREEVQESRMRIENFGYQLNALQKKVLHKDTQHMQPVFIIIFLCIIHFD